MHKPVFNQTMDRRRFIQLTKAYGLTAVALTGTTMPFFSEEAVAQTAKEEKNARRPPKRP